MRRIGLVAVFGTLFAMASGCANNNKTSLPKSGDIIAAKLAAVQMSDGLTANPDLIATCDPDATTTLLGQSAPATTANVPTLWNECQRVYACSASASQFIKTAFASGATFRLGYTDLKKLNSSRLGEKALGLYLSYSSNVYLDQSLKTPLQSCHMLLHELVHRFDPSAESGESSLRTEYAAYWHQTAFIDDLLLRQDSLGQAVGVRVQNGDLDPGVAPAVPTSSSGWQGAGVLPYHTRESLLYAVAQAYGFPVDESIVKLYPKLPREP